LRAFPFINVLSGVLRSKLGCVAAACAIVVFAAAGAALADFGAAVVWEPVDGADGYRVRIRYDESSSAAEIDLGAVRADADGFVRVIVDGLPLGPTANFAVAAYDDSGNASSYSSERALVYSQAAAVVDGDADGLVDAAEDTNLDGRTSAGETDASNPDTDGDGLSDGTEVLVYGTDPLKVDTDEDGPSDAEEIAAGTDPLDPSANKRNACGDGCADVPCSEVSYGNGCDDGNECTDDVCEAGACAYLPVEASCDDGSACTILDVCSGGRCGGEDICGGDADAVYLSPASSPGTQLSGNMRLGVAYANGADEDPDRDSLAPVLLYAADDSNALGGGSNDSAVLDVDIPSSGRWYLWGRFYYPGQPDSNDANSFLIRVDDRELRRFGNNRDYFRRWHWDGDGGVEHGAPVPLDLGTISAGRHRLTIEKREVRPLAPRLDALMLTRSAEARPSDGAALDSLDFSGGSAPRDTTTTSTLRSPTTTTTTTTVPVAGCLSDAECDDGSPCTKDICAEGGCRHSPRDASCDDGRFCNGEDFCVDGGCTGHKGDPCAGGDVCADTCDESSDSCDSVSGAPCSDGDLCTTGDTCDGFGRCVAGDLLDCSPIDGQCVRGMCDAGSGTCIARPVDESCDDGIACTERDSCSDGICFGSDACGAGMECNVSTGRCEAAGEDADNDGLREGLDPCPEDPRNRCFGQVAEDRATGVELRINANALAADCAGPRVDCAGDFWAGDFGYNRKQAAEVCEFHNGPEGCMVHKVADLFGCVDEATQDLFRCGHVDPSGARTLSYRFDVKPGEYLVNLFFAATKITEAFEGAVVFDIYAGGELVHEQFDPFRAAGDATTAVVRSIPARVEKDGVLSLDFDPVVGAPAVKAIEILK
jgi:hypothetical protein